MTYNPTKDLPLVERVIIQIYDDYFNNRGNEQVAINFIENNIPKEKLEEYLEGISYT
ncbi:MAG: hypothetical protein VW715_08745 [Rhodospirillales bacterium]